MYKMANISAETFAENSIHTITVHKKDIKSVLWLRIRC